MELKDYTKIIEERIESQKTGPKIDFEFQELCLELQPIYGKRIWTLPYKVGYTEKKIRKAHEIAMKKGILKINYLIGIINKLKPYEY